MINFYRRSVRDDKLVKIEEFKKGCWIDVVDPDKQELKMLEKTYNLDKQNLLSGLDKNEVPRTEVDEGNVYIILKTVNRNENSLKTFMIIISDTFIMTFSRSRTNFIDRILKGQCDITTTQKSKFLLTLLSLINKEFEKSTLDIIRSVNNKKSSLTSLKEKDIEMMLEQEDILNSFVSSYSYTALVYDRMMKHIRLYEEDKEIVEDLIIEAQQGLDICKSTLKTISNMRSHYEILLSNKLNKIITLMTVFTIFVSIPSAISGLYGMNLILPIQSDPNAFNYIVAVILAVWVALIVFFRKKNII